MSKTVNSKLSTLANAFPGNKESAPDFSKSDPLYSQAFKLYQSSTPVNEFVGLPTSDQLMRDFDTNFQKALAGQQTVDQALTATQAQVEGEVLAQRCSRTDALRGMRPR